MVTNKKLSRFCIHICEFFPLFLIVIIGLYFRLKGISDNHSFWTDEGLTAGLARELIQGKISIKEVLRVQDYQPLQIFSVALSFIFFGPSEWSARIIPVLMGTLGIIFAYLLTTKLSNKGGGLLAAFLYSFLQINIANSVQAKQYSMLQTLHLMIIYLVLLLDSKKIKKKYILHILIICLSSISTLLHFLGIFVWIYYILRILHGNQERIINQFKKPLFFITFIIITIFFALLFNIRRMVGLFFNGSSIISTFFTFNHFLYFKQLFLKQYIFLFFPTLICLYILFKKNKILVVSVGLFIILNLYLWTFKQYTHNIRYVIPLFGILITFSSAFWAIVGEKYLKRYHEFAVFIPSILILLFFVATQYKLTLRPSYYYNPNKDFYGDVQIADYKNMFLLLKKRVPEYKKMPLYSDLMDTQLWYLPDKPITAYFMKGFGHTKPIKYSRDGKLIYFTLSQFLEQKTKYPKGLLIVEDWNSFLPEEIKQYAKKNMKLEVRVDGLVNAPQDPWPLEIYSWGL